MSHQTLQGPRPAARCRRGGAARAEQIPIRAGCWVLAVLGTTWLLAAVQPAPAQNNPPRPPTVPGVNGVPQQPPGGPVLPAPKPVGQPAPADATLPPPRSADLFIGHPRLAGLPATVPPPVGTTPTPTKEVRDKFGRYIDTFVDPENTLDLILGRPRLLNL